MTLASVGLGCQPCDADACSDHLRIIIREASAGAIMDGIYDIQIVTDLAQYEGSCTVSGLGRNAACEGFGPVLTLPKFGSTEAAHEEIWIDFPDASMSETGAAGLPEEVQVSITFSGAMILSETVTPQYEVEDAECHPECVNDLVELSFSR